MRKLTLPSRYTILLAILVVLFIQLILWFVVVFRPQSSITIYLEQLDVQHNQLEFENAIMGLHPNVEQEHFDLQNAIIDPERVDSRRKAWDARRGDSMNSKKIHGLGSLNKPHDSGSLHARHKKSGILARLEAIKLEKMVQQLGEEHEAHGLHNTRTERNETNPVLQERAALIASPWSEETRQRLLHHLQPSLFTQNLAPLSDSSCDLVDIEAPKQLCRHHYEWECRHSHTFTQHFRHNRTLRIDCPGDLRVDWYFERNGGLTSDVMKNYTNQYSEWSHVTGPIDIQFPTQYADVMCRVETDNGTETHHNYRTQFIPNTEAVKTQRRTLDQLKSQEPSWQPLSILAINVDSLSRAQFHRPCGLPKTTQLLTKLFHANNKSSHQAFLFNRLNAIGGVTAMNLTPLYAGIFFRKADEEKRVLQHRYTKPIKEWMWDYANERGYLTSYAMDTGNGLMGTRTICPTHPVSQPC